MKKIKAKTKKILVLSVMVVLLVATGVLNFVLTDKLTNKNSDTPQPGNPSVTQTFFAGARSDREATFESQFLYYDAIIQSETSSDDAKEKAETDKANLITKMGKANDLETLVKSLGFDDAFVTMSDNGINVVVDATELTGQETVQIFNIICSNSDIEAKDIKVSKY